MTTRPDPTASLPIPSDAALRTTGAGWRDVDWEPRHRFIDVAGYRLHYVELDGPGTPLLFIHGLGGNWTVWLENLPAFARHHRVIAVDLPGFGGSPLPSDAVSIEGYGHTLEAFCSQLGLDSVIVIGSSLGGWVSAELTLRAPERVVGLILVDAAGIVPTRLERWKSLSLMEGAAVMAPLAPRFRKSVAARRGLRKMALRYTIDRPADLAADLVFMALPPAPDPGFRPALTACRRSWSEAWCDRLSEIKCPTLIVWGDRDSLLPLRHAREWAQRIPASELRVVAQAGHLPMLEHPEQFNQLGLEFVESLAGRNPTSGASSS
jgi:pimeloyl-ACP methyl ester carboxylesterase